jgi:hypothetical protein
LIKGGDDPTITKEVNYMPAKPKTVKAKKLRDLKPAKDAKGGKRTDGGGATVGR